MRVGRFASVFGVNVTFHIETFSDTSRQENLLIGYYESLGMKSCIMGSGGLRRDGTWDFDACQGKMRDWEGYFLNKNCLSAFHVFCYF